MSVNGLDSIVNQSLGMATQQQANQAFGSSDKVNLSHLEDQARKTNTFDRVQLSSGVPRPLAAKVLEEADLLASKLESGGKLKQKDTDALREDRVFAALVAMRLMENSSGQARAMWLGGIPSPTKSEIDEAYRRLTQRLVEPAEVEDAASSNNMRIDLLEKFRDFDYSVLNTEYASMFAAA